MSSKESRKNLSEVQCITLSDLPSRDSVNGSFIAQLNGTRVEVRGFWYPISSDEGILAQEPRLKSCCIKTPAKIEQQILVKNASFSIIPERAVTIEGRLNIAPHYDQEGELTQLYVIEDARVIKKTNDSFFDFVPSIGSILLLLLAFIFLFFRRLRR